MWWSIGIISVAPRLRSTYENWDEGGSGDSLQAAAGRRQTRGYWLGYWRTAGNCRSPHAKGGGEDYSSETTGIGALAEQRFLRGETTQSGGILDW